MGTDRGAVDVKKVIAGASVQVRTGKGKYYGLSLNSDGAVTADVLVFDAVTDTNDIDAARTVIDGSVHYQFKYPIAFQAGLRVNVTGVGAIAYVHWAKVGA